MRLVSVITPAYNASGTLRRACESVQAQADACWEHIVIDDGSTDSTQELIETLREESRIATKRIANRGPGGALNAGLDLAQGEYIAFLDADDEYLPNHLSAHLAFFEAAPEIDLVWGGMEVIAERYEDSLVPDVEAGSGFIPVSECIVQGTIFGRSRVFAENRFSEDRSIWYQDYEFVNRMRPCFRVDRFPSVTYRYYRNSGQSLVDRAKAGWSG